MTEQQINFFSTFGYLSFPGLMADRIEDIESAFEQVWQEHGGGHNGKQHEGKARSCIVPFIDQSEYLCSLLDDPRILDIAITLLGDDFNYMGSDGNYMSVIPVGIPMVPTKPRIQCTSKLPSTWIL